VRAPHLTPSIDISAEDAFRQHRGRIYRFFRGRLLSHHDAEDLTQRVFLDAVAALSEESRPPDSVLAWLYVVAQRRLVDEIRRRGRVSDLAPERQAASPAAAYGPAVAASLAEAIRRLPEGQRRVVVLRLLKGMSFREIGAQLGMSEAAAKMRFTRGLDAVRQHLVQAGLDHASD
jgi:RNA polymerase sigma factor (sigma-70 family)